MRGWQNVVGSGQRMGRYLSVKAVIIPLMVFSATISVDIWYYYSAGVTPLITWRWIFLLESLTLIPLAWKGIRWAFVVAIVFASFLGGSLAVFNLLRPVLFQLSIAGSPQPSPIGLAFEVSIMTVQFLAVAFGYKAYRDLRPQCVHH